MIFRIISYRSCRYFELMKGGYNFHSSNFVSFHKPQPTPYSLASLPSQIQVKVYANFSCCNEIESNYYRSACSASLACWINLSLSAILIYLGVLLPWFLRMTHCICLIPTLGFHTFASKGLASNGFCKLRIFIRCRNWNLQNCIDFCVSYRAGLRFSKAHKVLNKLIRSS